MSSTGNGVAGKKRTLSAIEFIVQPGRQTRYRQASVWPCYNSHQCRRAADLL